MTKPLFITRIALLFIFFAVCSFSSAGIAEYIESNEAITAIKKIEIDSSYSGAWVLCFEQPLDHNNPDKGTFKQRIWLSHKSKDAPVVLVTEGYMAPRNYIGELARLVGGNQIIVEHRYFDSSVPDSIDWQYLTIEQAAMDHHRVVEALKPYYKGKWINTGISKGGQTAMIHRAFWPEDVDITVPYVAPFNLEEEDHRLLTFFDKVGSEEQRKQIVEFQKKVLQRKDALMPLFKEVSKDKGYTYRMGDEKAFELSVLEYPFSVWQWGRQVEYWPGTEASDTVLFEQLKKGTDFGYFSDQQWQSIGPFFYQAYKELGYYSYLATPLKPWLEEIENDTVSNKFMAPCADNLNFDEQLSHYVLERLKKADPNMIVITGENDPWSATSLNPEGFNNVLKIEKPGGSHLTRINNLPDSLREQVIHQLKEWLNE
jgi:hypothetical protein